MNPADLVRQCADHLTEEEGLLRETRMVLREIRAALLRQDLDALGDALRHQERVAAESTAMQERRLAMRRGLAKALHHPEETIRLSLVAAQLPEVVRNRLLRWRDRLQRDAAEIDQLNRGNAALILHNLDFQQRLLDALTGDGPGVSYTLNGTKPEAVRGSLLEARG